MLWIVLALLFILSCVPLTSQASSWTTVVVDSGGGAPGPFAMTSLALDANSAVHISYKTDSYPGGQNIKYATNSGGTWSVSTIEQMQFAGMRIGPSVTVDEAGSPHVVYSNGTEIKHAWLSSGTWKNETLASDVFAYGIDSAFDSTGQLHVCYIGINRSGIFNLTCANQTPSGWNSTVIVTNQSMDSVSMLVDDQGKTCMCFSGLTASAGGFSLSYAEQDGGVKAVSEVYPHAGPADMAADSKGDCHIAFIDSSGDADHLMYISSNNGTWQPSTLTTIDDQACWDPSITIDSKDREYVSYTASDGPIDLLRCAVKTNDGWEKQTIDRTSSSDSAFLSPSIAVDSAGTAHISYWKGWGDPAGHVGGLMYASGIVSTEGSFVVIVSVVVLAAVAISGIVFVIARRRKARGLT